MNRTTLILALVAAVLAGFILVFERGSLSTGEVAMREGRVLPRFVRDKVTRIEVTQGDRHLVIARKPDPEFDDQLGLWQLREPVEGDVDDEAVNLLLSELEWMDARRRLEGLSAEDMAEFGLDAPRIEVRYAVAGEQGSLKIGDLSPMGDGHYVQADAPDTAYVVGKDLFEALDQDPLHYHSKEVHGGGLFLATAKWIELGLEGQESRFEKRDGRWWMTKPEVGWANTRALDRMIEALEHLKAKRYAAPPAEDLSAYGFDDPVFDLKLHKRTLVDDGGEDERFEDRTLRIRAGDTCGEHADERYMMTDGRPVMCVAKAELAEVTAPLGPLREPRLLTLSPGDVEAVEVDEGGRSLRVQKQGEDGDTWSYTLREGERVLKQGQAETDSVQAWFAFLGSAEAVAFDQGEAQAGPVRSPVIEARFVRGGDKPDYTLAVFAQPDEAEVLVRRGDEPQLLAFQDRILTPLHASAAPFRTRKLLDGEASELQTLEVTRGPITERLEREPDGGFRVVKPVSMPADPVVMQELSRLLAGLEAAQFISDAPAPEQGLDGHGPDPIVARFTLGAAGSEPATHVLRVGAPAPALEGYYAQLDRDPAVFIAPLSLVQKLAQPLISRVRLAVPLEDLQAVAVEGPDVSCRVSASATPGAFGFGDQPASPEARAVAEALATLRADGVTRYGGADAAKLDATLTVTTRTNEVVTLGLAPPDAEGRVLAIRGDDSVGLWLAPEQRQQLLACP